MGKINNKKWLFLFILKEHSPLIICCLLSFILGTYIGPRNKDHNTKKEDDKGTITVEECLDKGYVFIDLADVIHAKRNCSSKYKMILSKRISELRYPRFCSCMPLDLREKIEAIIKEKEEKHYY